MTGFFCRRALQTLIVLGLMSFLAYGLIGLMPGDPVDLMITSDPHMTPEKAARLKSLYGLDQPLAARYGHWLGSALKGDFGYSRLYASPVADILGLRLLATLMLMIPAFVLSLALAVPLGVHAAQRPGSVIDRLIGFLAFSSLSIPPFWLALMLILLFSATLGLLPASGGDSALSMILPVATLALAGVGGYTRYVRAAMIEALGADHIRTARAKGCAERRVVWRHAFRAALLPIITVIALDIGSFFSGALVTETMFALPGMGKTIYDAIMGNDYNLALCALLLATGMVALANLAADVLGAALDPRIEAGT